MRSTCEFLLIRCFFDCCCVPAEEVAGINLADADVHRAIRRHYHKVTVT
jgi:hypothetical protein